MRAAVITDIHANLQATEAVLAAIDEAGIDQTWCLGDLVGYGADPDRCVALAREHCDVCLLGNHDLAVLGRINISSFSPAATEAVEWTRSHTSADTFAYLEQLEPTAEREGYGLFHASPRDPVWEYVLSSDQAAECLEVQADRISLIGHSHIALFFQELAENPGKPHFRIEARGAQAPAGLQVEMTEGRWLLNPGSVGQPRDSDARAAWLELDTDTATATFHRVPYDIEGAARAITAASLPHHLANRLYVGR